MTDIFTFRNPQSAIRNGGAPLAGTSVVVQPGLSVRGWPTEAGSAALEGYVALEDATIVERLAAAGAELVGSSRMAELGLGLTGDTTAEALAECDAALVTDTVGEARVAAAAAGAFGLKPSYGVLSRFGLIGLVPSMEATGIVARSPEQIAAVLAAAAGPDERDPSMRDGDPPDFAQPGEPALAAIGVVRECTDALEPDEADAFRQALGTLEAADIRVGEVSIPDFDLFAAVHRVVGSVEASSAAGKYDSVRYGHRAEGTDNWNDMYLQSRAESFGTTVKTWLFQGACFQFENYTAFENACRIRRRLVEQTDAALAEVDALVSPTRRPSADATTAGTLDEIYAAFALTLPANVTGHPALAIPGLGLQLVGPPLADPRLLAFAARLAAPEA